MNLPPTTTHEPAPSEGNAEPLNPHGNANTGNPRPTARRHANSEPTDEGEEKNTTADTEAEAKMLSPWEVQVTTAGESRVITAQSIVIAAGARPSVPPIQGIEDIDYLTSDNLWALRDIWRGF